ncbi:hypothetical protein WDW89_14105 [Deltaproteobacteria bacterium TL4]
MRYYLQQQHKTDFNITSYLLLIPILGLGMLILRPSIVAANTELLNLDPDYFRNEEGEHDHDLWAQNEVENSGQKLTQKKNKKSKKKKLKWSGDFKFALRYAKNRTRVSEVNLGFELSDVNLKLQYDWRNGWEFQMRYQINPETSELQSAYLRYSPHAKEAKLDKNKEDLNRITLGLQSRLFKLDSDLETDNLNKIALYHSRDSGIQGRLALWKSVYLAFGLMNGPKLDTRDISARQVSKQDIIIADNDDKTQVFSPISRRELTSGLGFRYHGKHIDKCEILLFHSASALSDTDVDAVNVRSEIPGFTGIETGTELENLRSGINFEMRSGNLRSYNQYALTTIRLFQRSLFGTEWSYEYGDWKPIVAYSQQRLNLDPNPEFPISWGRARYTLGLHYQWDKAIKFAAEMTLNDEETGGDFINNDEFILMVIATF